jgi:hypothetical protein
MPDLLRLGRCSSWGDTPEAVRYIVAVQVRYGRSVRRDGALKDQNRFNVVRDPDDRSEKLSWPQTGAEWRPDFDSFGRACFRPSKNCLRTGIAALAGMSMGKVSVRLHPSLFFLNKQDFVAVLFFGNRGISERGSVLLRASSWRDLAPETHSQEAVRRGTDYQSWSMGKGSGPLKCSEVWFAISRVALFQHELHTIIKLSDRHDRRKPS